MKTENWEAKVKIKNIKFRKNLKYLNKQLKITNQIINSNYNLSLE